MTFHEMCKCENGFNPLLFLLQKLWKIYTRRFEVTKMPIFKGLIIIISRFVCFPAKMHSEKISESKVRLHVCIGY